MKKNLPNFRTFGYLPSGAHPDPWSLRHFGYPNLMKRLQARDLFNVLDIKETDCVLDFGCGYGFITVEMARLAKAAVGIDIDPYLNSIIIPKDLVGKLRYLQMSGTRLPFPEGFFNLILASEVLPMLPDPSPFLREIHRVLHPQGRLVVLNGAGHPTIKKAYAQKAAFLKGLKRLYPVRFPDSYESYSELLQASFGTSQKRFFEESDMVNLLTQNHFAAQSVQFTPNFLAGLYLSWTQFLRYLRQGKTLSQRHFIWQYYLLDSLRFICRKKHKGGLLCVASPIPHDIKTVAAPSESERRNEYQALKLTWHKVQQHLAASETESAIQLLLEATRAYPKVIRNYLQVSELYCHTGNLKAALSTLETGLVANPNTQSLAEQLAKIKTLHNSSSTLPGIDLYLKQRHPIAAPPYPLNTYAHLLLLLKTNPKVSIIPFARKGATNKINIIIRHDIDTNMCVQNMSTLLDIDLSHDIPASVFLRADELEYPLASLRQTIGRYRDCRISFGLHTACYTKDNYHDEFLRETEHFKNSLGFAPEFFTIHGLGKFRLDTRNQFISDIETRLTDYGYTFSDCSPVFRQYGFAIEDCHLNPADNTRFIYDDFASIPPFFKPGQDYVVLTHPCYWERG